MDYIKTTVSVHLLDRSEETNIFPRTPFGSAYSTMVLYTLQTVLGISNLDS